MPASVAAVQARIAQIQNSMAPPAPATVAPTQNSFASVLEGELHTHSTGATTNAEGVPTDLAAYGNGRIPATALTPIGVGQHRLWAPAAHGFKNMTAAAARDGVKIGVTDSYRSYDQQVDLAKRKGLYKNGGLAATPGTSDHGWGRSVDLDLDAKAQAWMRKNGPTYGFVEDVPREPWHWTFKPS